MGDVWFMYVWIVFSHDHECRYVEYVCDTEEVAEEYRAKLPDRWSDIEKFGVRDR